jgi:hypothetical protein
VGSITQLVPFQPSASVSFALVDELQYEPTAVQAVAAAQSMAAK